MRMCKECGRALSNTHYSNLNKPVCTECKRKNSLAVIQPVPVPVPVPVKHVAPRLSKHVAINIQHRQAIVAQQRKQAALDEVAKLIEEKNNYCPPPISKREQRAIASMRRQRERYELQKAKIESALEQERGSDD